MSQNQQQAVYDARSLGIPKMAAIGVQHLFAMFGATILVPILTGLSPSATLLFAGLGTLLFHLITKRLVPAFLGSSFAYLVGYFMLTSLAGKPGYEHYTKGLLLQYASIGVAASAVIYFLLSAATKCCGVKRVMRFFPPVVTGPIIIGIGLVLAPVAVNSCRENWPTAVIAIITIALMSVKGRGFFRVVPILLGVLASYFGALLLSIWNLAPKIDYTAVINAPWIGWPLAWSNTTFPVLAHPDAGLLITSLLTVVPIAFATVMEHIGDISAISATVQRNYFENPGLHRTLLGDGLATMLAALFGAPANTTYGENTGVLSITRVYDPSVIRISALLAILISFCPKIYALIGTIPAASVGGVSFVLYGMISAVGIRNLVESRVDFSKSRNMLIAALILVLALGIAFSKEGALNYTIGNFRLSFSGLAVGAIAGIFLNVLLPDIDLLSRHKKPAPGPVESSGNKNTEQD